MMLAMSGQGWIQDSSNGGGGAAIKKIGGPTHPKFGGYLFEIWRPSLTTTLKLPTPKKLSQISCTLF